MLLLAWTYPIEEKYDILEFYAGTARITKCARRMGLTAGALDVTYHDNPRVFNMLSEAGFGLLGFITSESLPNVVLGDLQRELC